MADKVMYIQNDDTQNYPFCRLQLVADTFVHLTFYYNQNQNSINVPKVLIQRIRNSFLEYIIIGSFILLQALINLQRKSANFKKSVKINILIRTIKTYFNLFVIINSIFQKFYPFISKI